MKGSRPPRDEKAERRKAVLSALKNYNSGGSIRDRYVPALDVLVAESDRGAIILVAGILDDMLGERIINRLPNGKQQREDLLRQGGVLGWFADRMTFALALGIIDQETFDDIELIRLLRNKCAHTIGSVSLKEPAFNDVLALLVDPLTSENIGDDDVTDLFLRNVLSFVMVFVVERIMGKTALQAQETVSALVESMAADIDASPETHPKQSG